MNRPTQFFKAGETMKGEHTRLLQCVVGWTTHDAKAYFGALQDTRRDLYGFARPRGPESSLPLSIDEYLSRPIESFQGKDGMSANDRNIAALARYYNGLPLDFVKQPKR